MQLFVVQRLGPTSFVVREDGSDVKRKVVVGSRMACSCCQLGVLGTVSELCVHILFVVVKVLRVPPSNALVWQLSLLGEGTGGGGRLSACLHACLCMCWTSMPAEVDDTDMHVS